MFSHNSIIQRILSRRLESYEIDCKDSMIFRERRVSFRRTTPPKESSNLQKQKLQQRFTNGTDTVINTETNSLVITNCSSGLLSSLSKDFLSASKEKLSGGFLSSSSQGRATGLGSLEKTRQKQRAPRLGSLEGPLLPKACTCS